MNWLESEFKGSLNEFIALTRHFDDIDRQQMMASILCNEARKTSEIDGEFPDRKSLQFLFGRYFEFCSEERPVQPAEQGIAQIMWEVFQTPETPLSHEMLHGWHKLLMAGRSGREDAGCYRANESAMQVLPGSANAPALALKHPPSSAVQAEMERFIEWFNATGPDGVNPLPLLTRAGIANLYFQSIHPFQDGNGRIGRVLVEKAVSQNLGFSSMPNLSSAIMAEKYCYYTLVAWNSRDLEIN